MGRHVNSESENGRSLKGVIVAACFGVILTVLSQIVPLLQIPYGLIWIALAVYCGTSEASSIRLSPTFLASICLYISFVVFCIVCFFITGIDGYLRGFPILLAKPLLMYVVGYFLYFRIDDLSLWKYIVIAYIASSIVYGIWAFITYVPSLGAWLTTQKYLFASKNSFGQILCVASIFLAASAIREGLTSSKIVLIAASFGLAFLAMIMQCRTSLLALSVGIFVLLCCSGNKRILIVAAICAVALVILSPTVQTYISHALFLDKYRGADLNTFSSGRINLWADARVASKESPLIGLGSYYVDCFYINTYANVGLIGSILVFALWGIRVAINIVRGLNACRQLTLINWLRIIAFSLTAFYLVESILEGNPPFGPGACSFLFWLFSGLLDAADVKRDQKAGDKVLNRYSRTATDNWRSI